MRQLTHVFLVLLFLQACGSKSDDTQLVDGASCKQESTAIYAWMDERSSCSQDADCEVAYGGCFAIHHNKTASGEEIKRMVSEYSERCLPEGTLCGVNPGKAACRAGKCFNSYGG